MALLSYGLSYGRKAYPQSGRFATSARETASATADAKTGFFCEEFAERGSARTQLEF